MRDGVPRCALCGTPVKETDRGVEYCASCGVDNPPTKPLALQEIQAACEDMAWAITTLHPNKQAGYLTYILEGLEKRNGTMADRVLEDLQDAIGTRLEVGRW